MAASNKTIIKAYLYLLLFTVLSAFMGSLDVTFSAIGRRSFVAFVLLIVVIKGFLIVDVFMEIKFAPGLWRKLLYSYVILIPVIIVTCYLMS